MKIICIGRNYAEHAKELNNAIPTEPVFFMKPDTALLKDSDPFYYPDFTKDLHHEIEIVIKINKVGKHIDEHFAHKYYDEIGLGIDFTARSCTQASRKRIAMKALISVSDKTGIVEFAQAEVVKQNIMFQAQLELSKLSSKEILI